MCMCLQRHTHPSSESSSPVLSTKCVLSAASKSSQQLPVQNLSLEQFQTYGLILHGILLGGVLRETPVSSSGQQWCAFPPKQLTCFSLKSTGNYFAYQNSHFALVIRKLRAKSVAFSYQSYRSLCWALLAFFVTLFSAFIFHLLKCIL